MSDPIVISSERMTGMVEVDSRGIIVDAPPIMRKFIGQPFENLREWMRKQGGLQIQGVKVK